MILTYKIKHNKDYSKELILAEKIAWHGKYTGSRSSADVKHIGLKSMISNQILKKYSNHRKLKNIKSVKLAIPGQGIKIKGNQIYLPCLKLSLDIYFNRNFDKINQIEIGKEFAYISVSYPEVEQIKPTSFFGVDRNSTSHVLVASNTKTGKVLKLGKSCKHIHNKYKEIRRSLGKKKKLKKLKSIKNREKRIIKNINHKISKALVERCLKDNSAIVLEDLKSIRKTAKSRRKNRYTLNSWSFYQLAQMIEYKSKKLGIPIFYVEPQYTSQRCSDCGHIEKSNRQGKLFSCNQCGKVENADVNAGFNIAELHQLSISQFSKESDLLKGNTDIPKEAMVLKSN